MYKNEKYLKRYRVEILQKIEIEKVVGGWMDRRMYGWVGECESSIIDCLQQYKTLFKQQINRIEAICLFK